MKRSEMIEIIAIELLVFDNDIKIDQADFLADVILTKIEKAGMLPPDNCSKKCHKENYENCGNVWESENG